MNFEHYRSSMKYALMGWAAFAALSAVMMLWWPLGFDHGIFALNGATVLRGGLPYKDAWETRGPLSFYLFAGVEAVFGRSAFAIRLFDVLLLVAADTMLWRLLRRLRGPVVATVLVTCWTLSLVSLSYLQTAQPDLWVGYAVLGALVACGRPRGYSASGLVIAGVLVGLCTLLKPFYAGFLATPMVFVLWRLRDHDRSVALVVRDLFILCAAWVAPVLVVLLVLWASGAMPEFLAVHVWYNVKIYSGIDHPSRAQMLVPLWNFLRKAGVPFIASLPLVGIGLMALWRISRPFAAAAAVAIVVGACSVVLQGRFYTYHWAPVFVVCAPLLALGVHAMTTAAATWIRGLGWLAFAAIAGAVSVRPATYLREWLPYVAGQRSATQYYATFGAKSATDPGDQIAAAAYLKAHAPPGAPIASWGRDAAIPFLADRPPVSRFPVTDILTMAPNNPVTRAYRAEFLNAMVTRRPPYIVLGLHSGKLGLTPPQHLGQQVPELGNLLATQYVFDRRFGDVDVYRRTDFAAAPSGS